MHTCVVAPAGAGLGGAEYSGGQAGGKPTHGASYGASGARDQAWSRALLPRPRTVAKHGPGMLSALIKAVAQITDPAFRRVLLISVAASAVVFVVLWLLAWWGLSWTGEALADWLAAQEPGGFWTDLLAWIFGAAAVVGIVVATFFLFPAVMVLVMSMLLDEVAAAVEHRHYPDRGPARRQPWGEMLWSAVVFAAVTVALNLLVLPLYLLLLFVPPLNLFVFYLLNGYLLGREYFELVAVRRYAMSTVAQVRRAFRGRLMLAGVAIAVLMTIPLVNLIAPLVATAFMVHVFEGLRRREKFAAVVATPAQG